MRTLLGRHLWNPLAAAIYGLNLMTVNALGTLLWFYASSRPGIISEGISPRAIRFMVRLHSARIAVYAAAVLLAPWLTIGSVALFAAATIIFGLPNPFLERRFAELGLTLRLFFRPRIQKADHDLALPRIRPRNHRKAAGVPIAHGGCRAAADRLGIDVKQERRH